MNQLLSIKIFTYFSIPTSRIPLNLSKNICAYFFYSSFANLKL